MSKDNLPVAMLFFTCDFKVEHYLNPTNCNKVLGTTFHPTVGPAAHNISIVGHL